MLDHRLQTFLTLCETGNYTKTAEILNMTQPAVSQHIRYLENHYQVVLVSGKGKHFALTEEGKALREYAKTLNANSERIMFLLHRIKDQTKPMNFGATLTIGEYMMPPIITRLLQEEPEISVSMYVENTDILLHMLWEGKIDFALLEGHFNHSQFEYKVISQERFVGVCSPQNPIASRNNDIRELLDQTLILREPGSGSRDILEQALYNQNLSTDDFRHTIEVGNLNVIKDLCHHNMGISFLYWEAVKREISHGYLQTIPMPDFEITHPFSFVYLKNSPDRSSIEYWFNKIMSLRLG